MTKITVGRPDLILLLLGRGQCTHAKSGLSISRMMYWLLSGIVVIMLGAGGASADVPADQFTFN